MVNAEFFTGAASGAVIGGRFLKRDPAVEIGFKQCDTQGEKVRGLAYHDAVDKDVLSIVVEADKITVESGAAVTDGAELMTDNVGRAIPYVAGAGIYVCAVAMSAASGAGKELLVRFQDNPSQ